MISADCVRVPKEIPIVETHISPISVPVRSNNSELTLRKLLTEVPIQRCSEDVQSNEKKGESSETFPVIKSEDESRNSRQKISSARTNSNGDTSLDKEPVAIAQKSSSKSSAVDGRFQSKCVTDISDVMQTKCNSNNAVLKKKQSHSTTEGNIKQTTIERDADNPVHVKADDADDRLKGETITTVVSED